MPRDKHQSIDLSSQDSFLDIVANIVGILILLVMVVGVRANQHPKVEPEAFETLTKTFSSRQELKQSLTKIAVKKAELNRVAMITFEQREELAASEKDRLELITFTKQVKAEIASRRESLTASDRRDFDTRNKLNDAKRQLEILTQQQVALIPSATKTKVIENSPTPLSKKIKGDIATILISGGRVGVVPYTELHESMSREIPNRRHALAHRDVTKFSVQPINGFRLICHLVKASNSPRLGNQFNVAIRKTVIQPTNYWSGEPFDLALEADSTLMSSLQELSPQSTTIVLFFHPDGFSQSDRLKKMLHDKGFTCASEPVRAGGNLVFSPDGAKLFTN